MTAYRPAVLVIGVLLVALGAAMLGPALVDIAFGHPDWRVFILSGGLTAFVGAVLAAASWGRADALSIQQGFLLTVGAWVALVAFAAIPFSFSELGLSYTDAFFEAMSGLTTTGSTVLSDLESAPPGVLMWRAVLQWLGGIGIIIMAIAVLPMLRIGGMQLFRLESSDTSEKILPRASQFAGAIAALYFIFTVFCYFAYWIAGMSPFEAGAHAMTTIATGGFSTSDQSFAAFSDTWADMVAVCFMIIGSLPFGLYLLLWRGRGMPFVKDPQVQFFLGAAATFIALMTAYLWLSEQHIGLDAFRLAAFNVISIMTGTGYASADYGAWGGFPIAFFFCIMFVGGCAGSTSCGLKVFRLQIALAAIRLQTRRMAHPHGLFTERYNGAPISSDVFASVFNFFFVYFACFTAIAMALSLHGLEPLTALSAAGTAIANVGPGLGEMIGPAGTFQGLDDSAKWILSFAMLLGRLELFTVLVLFAPSFWRH